MRLRDVIQTIVLAAPLAACCTSDGDWESESAVLPAVPDDVLAPLIAMCEAGDCAPICNSSWLLSQSNGYPTKDCRIEAGVRGKVLHYKGQIECVAGRRPAAYRASAPRATTVVGAYFAEQAALEAASVRAFRDLDADLAALGAPRSLRHAARVAAAQEVRHAIACARLALAYGGDVKLPRIAPAKRRTLREVAVDNAREGVAREAFGAAIAAYQARAASCRHVRRAMRAIAHDEAGHADFALRLHRWCLAQLRDHRDVIAAAQTSPQIDEVDPALQRIAGVPDASTARALYGCTAIAMS
jgi:hypothetical protein